MIIKNQYFNKLCRLSLAISISLGFFGCNAPRDNPLDPNSDHYVPPIIPDNPAVIEFFSIKTAFIGLTQGEEPRSTITAEAHIDDPDGIENVYLEIADSIRFIMPYDASVQHYRFEFNPVQTGYTIFNFVGDPFHLFVFDSDGHVEKSDKAMITRVLADLPELIWPVGGMISYTEYPTLVWKKYDVQFNINYSVQVRTLAGVIRYEENDIVSANPTEQGDLFDSLRVDTPLIDDDYLWNVWVYDLLGNFTRSETSRFVVNDTT